MRGQGRNRGARARSAGGGLSRLAKSRQFMPPAHLNEQWRSSQSRPTGHLLAEIQTWASNRGGTSPFRSPKRGACDVGPDPPALPWHGIKCLSLASSGVISLSSLCIRPGKAAWVLYVDATCINYDGNAFDATLIAMVAALKNSTLRNGAF